MERKPEAHIDVVGKSYLTLWYAESNKLTTN